MSYKLLKFISRRSGPVKDFEILKKFDKTVQKNIDYLIDQKFIDSIVYEVDPNFVYGVSGKYAFEITPYGQSAIEEIFDREVKYWIPIVISVIALIFSIAAIWLEISTRQVQ